ncbi:MAG: VPLPA-CTERM sorting domain-containing protein [Pseudomonadota bacterium]
MGKLKSTTALAALSIGALHALPASAVTQNFANGTGIDFPTSGPETALQTVESTLTGDIVDVDVTIEGIESTWSSDLEFFIQSPSGISVELMTNLFFGLDWTGEDITFDDEAPTDIRTSDAGIAGTFQPEGLLSDFDGETALGLWTLTFRDAAEDDFAEITGWSITITDDSGGQGPGSAVPLPASLPLALAGLGAFGALRRRRKKD